MSGYSTILRTQRFVEQARKLGFEIASPRYHGSAEDLVSLRPMQDCLPIYARDSWIITGTVEQLESWMVGVEWAREYDRMLKVSNSTKRQRKEQDWRNEELKRMLASQERQD